MLYDLSVNRLPRSGCDGVISKLRTRANAAEIDETAVFQSLNHQRVRFMPSFASLLTVRPSISVAVRSRCRSRSPPSVFPQCPFFNSRTGPRLSFYPYHTLRSSFLMTHLDQIIHRAPTCYPAHLDFTWTIPTGSPFSWSTEGSFRT